MIASRGMGDPGATASRYQPGSTFCNWFPTFLMSEADAMACAGISAPAVPNPPTQAELDAVAVSSDPGAAASVLTQALSNQAVLETQAQVQAAVGNVAYDPYSTLGVTSNPFCGTGSSQWISGVDNCVLLIGGGVVIIGIVAISKRSKRR